MGTTDILRALDLKDAVCVKRLQPIGLQIPANKLRQIEEAPLYIIKGIPCHLIYGAVVPYISVQIIEAALLFAVVEKGSLLMVL